MSRLDELIQQYCPDGVAYVALETVCLISKGIQFNKKDMHDEGTYPVINGGINPSGYIEQYNQEEKTITIRKAEHPLDLLIGLILSFGLAHIVMYLNLRTMF